MTLMKYLIKLMKKLISEYLIILKEKWLEILIIGGGLIAYSLLFALVLKNIPACIYKQIFGIPCPGCGITRAYLCLFHLDIKGAFYYHPLFWLLPIIAFVIIFNKHKRINKFFCSPYFWIICSILYLSLYIYRLICVYPNPPMEYYPLNLIERILRHF